jgi:hypothetical protein
MLFVQLALAAILSAGLVRSVAWAQSQSSPLEAVEKGPIPVITGSVSYQTNFSPGSTDVNPLIDPLILLPIGDKVLIQSEYEAQLDLVRDHGKLGPAVVDHGVEFLQADFLVHPNLTITVGRFLTPFGIYRERMDPRWTRTLQLTPILFPLNDNSSNGLQLHGSAHVTTGLDVTYATYYSVASTNTQLDSDRQTGFRSAIVLPGPRFEVGVSFSRVFGDNRHTLLGTDATWILRRVPLDIKAEFLRSKEAGKAYWIEAAYRLNQLGHNPLLRNSQVVFRQEQYWLPKDPLAAADFGLPDVQTNRSTIGLNYYLQHGVRLNAAYDGNYALRENSHTWNVGLTYRFATLKGDSL